METWKMESEKSGGTYIRELLRYWYNQVEPEKVDEALMLKGLLRYHMINHIAFRFQNEILTVHIFAGGMKMRIFKLKIGDDLLTHPNRDINFPKILKNSYSIVRNYQEASNLKLFYPSCGGTWLIVEEIHYSQSDSFSTTLHLVNEEGEIKMSKEKCLPEEKCDSIGFIDEPLMNEGTTFSPEDSAEDKLSGTSSVLKKSDSNVPQPCSNAIPTLFEWIIIKCLSFPGKILYRNTSWPNEKYYYEQLKKEYEGTLLFEYIPQGENTIKIDYLTLVAENGKYLVVFGSVSKSDNTDAFKSKKNRSGFCFTDPEKVTMFVIGYSQIRFNQDFRALYTRENKGVPKKVFELKLTMCNIKSTIQDNIAGSSQNDFLEIFTGPLQGATADSSHIDFLDPYTDTFEDEIETKELKKTGSSEGDLGVEESGIPQELSEREVKRLVQVTFGHFRARKKGILGRIQELHVSDRRQEGECSSQASTQELVCPDQRQEEEHDSQASTQELGRPATLVSASVFQKDRGFKRKVDSFLEETKEECTLSYKLLEAKMVLHGAMGECSALKDHNNLL